MTTGDVICMALNVAVSVVIWVYVLRIVLRPPKDHDGGPKRPRT